MTNPEAEGPVFIICFARTGSTLLRYILDTHPKVTCPPELHICHMAVQLWQRYDVILNVKDYASTETREATIISHIRDQVDLMMRHYCDSVGKTFWCEKSINTIDHIGLINTLYPNAKYICLYRNCFDQVRSGLEVLQRFDSTGNNYGYTSFLEATKPNTEAGLADYWINKTNKILKLENTFPERCFRITYESIVEGKESTFAPLFDFIGMEWDPGLLEQVFSSRHYAGPGDPKIQMTNKIHDNSIGRGKEIARAQLGADRIKTINKLNKRLGYKKIKFK